jgi:protein-L-isoaspartate(D-aspartate) O-methyltransferase
VAPLADPARGGQVLVVVDKLADGSLVQTRHEMVRFVPLESGISDYGHC